MCVCPAAARHTPRPQTWTGLGLGLGLGLGTYLVRKHGLHFRQRDDLLGRGHLHEGTDGAHVACEEPQGVRVLHLDGYLRAVPQTGAVHLPDRRGA